MGYLFLVIGIHVKQLYEITTVPNEKQQPNFSKKHFTINSNFHFRFI